MLKQQILRTKSRVQNNREEPIDYLAKCILMCYQQIEPSFDFVQGNSLEYRAPFSLLVSLETQVLQMVLDELGEFEHPDMRYEPYGQYWASMRELVESEIEIRQLGEENLFALISELEQ